MTRKLWLYSVYLKSISGMQINVINVINITNMITVVCSGGFPLTLLAESSTCLD